MAIGLVSATRRRNVSPISSIIRPDLTRDADCSAMSKTPEDGEFIMVRGGVGTSDSLTFYVDDIANIDQIDATDVQAASLRMVWASAEHTDRRQSGQTRVPYFYNGIVVETNLYYVADAALAVNNVTNDYANGRFVSVRNAGVSLQGSSTRLVIAPIPEAGAGWAVGQLESVPSAVGASGVVLGIRLYDEPRFIGARR